MSSLRNAVKRVTHKERAQPQARAHLGILEKKKDYQVRARDFHKKQDRIDRLKLQASMRNPDEFYFGMTNSHMVNGKHVVSTKSAAAKAATAREQELAGDIGGTDVIRIMKDQDLSYIRMQKQLDTAKINKLQASLHFLQHDDDQQQQQKDGDDDDDHNNNNNNSKKKQRGQKRKHTIFVDTVDDAKTFDVANHFGTVPQLANRAFNRPRVETLRQAALTLGGGGKRKKDDDYDDSDDDDDDDERPTSSLLTDKQLQQQRQLNRKTTVKVQRARTAAYAEMETRLKRVATLERAESHLTTEKLVASKGRKRKIKDAQDGTPAQYKWRRKRQR